MRIIITMRLTHWGRVTHICVNKQTIIGSVNGLSPRRRQAIIWTNAGILLIEILGTNFSEILIEIRIFSFKKMCLNVSSVKWLPFCLGLNVFLHVTWVLPEGTQQWHVTPWVNHVPRKMSDIRSRYARFTIAAIDVRMLRYMAECYGLFTTKINHFHLERQKLRKMVMKRVVFSALFCNHISLFSVKHEQFSLIS